MNRRGIEHDLFMGPHPTDAACTHYATRLGWLVTGLFYWNTALNNYRRWDGNVYHNYQPVLGLDGSIADLATLNATYPPGVLYRRYLAWTTGGGGVADDLYSCKKDAAGVYAWTLIGAGGGIDETVEIEELNFNKLFSIYATIMDTVTFQTRIGTGFYNRIETDGEGGRSELQTGNSNGDTEGSLFPNRVITRAREPDIGAVFNPISLTNVRFGFGLFRDNTHWVFVGFDPTVGANIIIETNNGGGPEQLDSGVAAVAGAYAYYRFTIDPITGFPTLFRYDTATLSWVNIAIAPTVGIDANVYSPFWFIATTNNASKRYLLSYMKVNWRKMVF